MPTMAKDFFKSADGHRKAVELLCPHEFKADGSRDSLFFAIYNLLGFTVELYLKAFLSKNGIQDSELSKRPYGHNLNNLFDKALECGFDVSLENMASIIEFLDVGHGEYMYRYVQDSSNLNYFHDLSLVINTLQQVHISMQDDLI